jgi:hypothetical protein
MMHLLYVTCILTAFHYIRYVFVQVEKDGTYKIVDSSNRGGKYFTGVGMLLTGAKVYCSTVIFYQAQTTHTYVLLRCILQPKALLNVNNPHQLELKLTMN